MTNGGSAKRPGRVLTAVGLGIAVFGLFVTLAVMLAGGNAVPVVLVLAGLVLAGIGFAQRMLAAVERR